MNKQFYDLTIDTLDDGTIRLEQRGYCGESAILDLHPAQVAYIADNLSANVRERVQTQPNWAMERIATLERRLCWMRDRFGECDGELPHDMYERCSEANAFYAWLNASLDIAMEFCADFTNAQNSSIADTQEASLSPGDGKCPPSTAKRAGAHPERVDDVRTGELFSGT